MKKIITAIILLAACSLAHAQNAETIIVLNEGAFGQGNGSVSTVSLDGQTTTNSLFQSANGLPLGDIVQWGGQFENQFYIVVNNGHRIVKANSSTFEQIQTLSYENQESPREIAFTNTGKAFVSKMNTASVGVIDPEKMTEIKNILVGQLPDKMFFDQAEQQLYVSNWGSSFFGTPDSTVFVIDTRSESVVDTLVVGASPRDLFIDNQRRLWVIVAEFGGTNAVRLFDLETKEQLKEWTFDTSVGDDFGYDTQNGWVYFVSGGLRRINTETLSLDKEFLIEGSWYSMQFLQSGSDVFLALGDAKDFTQAGSLSVYETDGSLRFSTDVGIAPGHITLNQNVITNNEESSLLPELFVTLKAYPNPFNPATNIAFTLNQSEAVTVSVFDLMGRSVQTLIQNERLAAGAHERRFDARGLASGLYLVQLRTQTQVFTQKITLIK